MDDNGETPLRLAIKNGHTKAVNALLEAEEFNINTSDGLWNYGWALLHWVIANDHKKIVEVLIASKASVNTKSENGWTPLHWAAENGYTDAINALLAAGADVDVRDCWLYDTPLHLAAENGHTDAVNALLAAEADVNLQNTDGRTPLHLAAKRGHVEIVKALIDKGADVNKEDKYGQTPLHWAAECGQVEIVKALVDRGADIDKRDKKGGISLGSAVNNYHNRHYTNNDNHIKMVKILVGHIAKLETAGLHISQDNLQLKDSVQLEYNSDIASSYREGLRKYKEEIEKLTKEDKPLYDFLKESNINELASIWEKNKDIRNKFDNQKSLQRQYPEYAYTLINKANEIKKEIFLHNHEPLIDALSTHYRRDFQAMIFAGIENFFKVHKDDFRKELGNGGITLINFVDFENFAERHAPTLKVRAFAKVIENNLSSESPDDQNIDQACSSSVDEQVPQPVSEITGIIKHIGASNSEASSELESNGNQQSTQPEFLTTNGNSSSIASESGSTKILVSDQENDIQNNNIQPSSRSEKRSKLPGVAASALAIAGVALGVAIAVHLEMLAVGIAVGACCLVAAAIIYYCNEPSKSLKNSNVQGFSEKVPQPGS
ncbi:ankyrin repeat domain-containing protein [Wolbachia endosymbiont of Drosophila bocki]|nr:ankyrin repeat domain-containing protein [Wolbachia endosymbiont of Drosophila bocki]MDE5057386.1 ankyrin repeat domain-containing protein [Wolbachia endosymbiont of Drosophila bocki]